MSGSKAARRTPPTLDQPAAPAVFTTAVATLTAVSPRAEISLDSVPAPQRLAPWTFALGAEVATDDDVAASGRLVLLHDPDGHDAWHGVLRLVGFVRAEVDGDLAGDPLLPAVGWSWLTDALADADATFTALGGTVTQTSSSRFGDIAGPRHCHEIELRASWTALDEDLTRHGEAFCGVLAAMAGLPPVGISHL